MRFRRLATTSALVVTMALLTSSCFAMRQFYWSNPNPASGGSTFAVQKMYPYSAVSIDTYQFVMVGWDDAGISTSKRRFDITGNYGGPYVMIQDNTLRNILLGGGKCVSRGIDVADITDLTWKLFRTSETITTGADNEGKVARQSMRINFPTGTDVYDFVFVTGAWSDDDDGIPEATDTFVCTGLAFTTIPVG